MAKLQMPATAGFNAGKNFMARAFPISDIVIDPEISKVFHIHANTLEEIREKIAEKGFDKSQPVVIWKEKNILVDGHTRLEAAKKNGLEEIPAVEMEFESREEALLYTFERQALRRNLSGPEILTAAQMLDGRKKHDGKGRAAEVIAKRLGISPATVYQAQAVLRSASEDDIEAIMTGQTSVKAVYTKTKDKPAATTADDDNPPQNDTPPDEPQRPKKVSDEKKFPVSDAQSLPEHIKLLKAAVLLLIDAEENQAAKLLVEHFLKKNEKNGFYELLPNKTRKILEKKL